MRYLLLCLGLALPLAGHAQTDQEARCANRQGNQDHFFALQGALQQEIGRRQAQLAHARPENTLYRIPVVFHVLHYGEPTGLGTNLASGQIYSQIEVLNEDFRRLNPDFANVPAQFQAVSGDANIEFYPARDAPTGARLREPGINRIQVPRQPGFFWTTETFDAQFKPGSIWDPARYLNVWVVDSLRSIDGLTAGYAQFPDLSGLAGLDPRNGLAQTDGVVVRASRLGSIVKAPWARALDNPRFDRGRTLTHEVGHYLGLFHPYQGGCLRGDFCDDTPAQEGRTFNCPTNRTSCSGQLVMSQNFLDTTDDRCMGLFTQCQVGRMRTVLEVSPRRRELPNSNVGVGDLATARLEEPLAQAVVVYPNPATGSVRVQLPTGLRAEAYALYTPLGQPVRDEALGGSQLTIDVSGLASGVYLLHLGTERGTVVKKVVVER
jgi:hypothetical protein